MRKPSPGSWRVRRRARADERFARAVDTPSDAGNGGPSDPKLAGELAVVTMLRRAAPDITPDQPDAAARERMRARVLAGTTVPPPRPSRIRHRIGAAGPRGRLLVALGAVLCLIVALSGMAMLASQNALPGDPLYAVRRTVESATLGLTMGQQARGNKHLEFAADRIADLDTLVAQHPDPNSSPIGDYLTAFSDFDADTTAGAADLDDFGAGNAPNVLAALRDWAADQQDRINALDVGLPAQARDAAARSTALLGRVRQRASGLLVRTSCYTVTSGAGDDLGVLPATGPCDRAPVGVGGVATSRSTPSDQFGPTQQHPGYSGPTGTVAPSPVSPSGSVTPPDTFQPGPVRTTTGPDTSAPSTTTQPGLPLPLPTLSLPPLPGA